MKQKLFRLQRWVRWHPRKTALIIVAGLLLLVIIIQLLYPFSRLPLYLTIDGKNVGGMPMGQIASQLDKAYANETIELYYGSRDEAYMSPKPAEFGVQVTNRERVEAAGYPLLLRLVPTSLFWAHTQVEVSAPEYIRDQSRLTKFVNEKLGESCNVEPKNASFVVRNNEAVAERALPGGTCSLDDVKSVLEAVEVSITKKNLSRIAMDEIPADIPTEQAAELVARINQQTDGGIPLRVNEETYTLPKKSALEWIMPVEKDGKLTVTFDAAKVSEGLKEPVEAKVYQAAGTTKVFTKDFQEVRREVGPDGRQLDIPATIDSMARFATGEDNVAAAQTKALPATLVYERSYSNSDEGLSALLKQHAEDNKGGEFGVSLIELSGDRRRADYNGDKQFVSASTYKLYVAYSVLKRVENGTMKWGDTLTAGISVEQCFNAMISRSDNACAESFVKKIGYRPLTNEAVNLGAKNTTFVDMESYKTTANDLSLFNAALESSQSLQGDSRAKLLDAMRKNIFRQGVPAGVQGSVANKVGFLDGYLHDAAIVYSDQGTYVLSVMTKDSSWNTIKALSKKIDEVRRQ